MKRWISISAVCLALLAVIACVPALGPAKQTVTIVAGDRVLAGSKSILPSGVTLTADHFTIHGVGSGMAAGVTFDLTITAAEGSVNIDLVSGQYTLTGKAWSTDTPAIDIGSASASADVVVGTPCTISLAFLPYTGTGTLALNPIEWWPNVIRTPGVSASAVAFDGTETVIPMTIDSSTSAHGSVDLEQGWWVTILKIYDAGALNAGVVRTARVAAGYTTTQTEMLQVNALKGQVTVDATWYGGDPLTVNMTPNGETPIYDGTNITFSATVPNLDAGKTAIYGFYLNGEVVQVGASNSYTVNVADIPLGFAKYLSLIVWQSDGRRAGDAQARVHHDAWPPEAYNVQMSGQRTTPGNLALLVTALDGTVVDSYRDSYESPPVVASHVFTLPAGQFKLAYRNVDGGAVTWLGGSGTVGTATVYTVPALPATSISFYAY